MLRIKLTMAEPQSKHSLTIEQECEVYGDLGDSVPFRLGSFINHFLRVYGYSTYDKEYVFLESVTAEEYDQLLDYLAMIREGNKNETV